MIIVEGPDGSGKSTLIDQLLASIPELELKKRHANTHGPITDLVQWIEEDRFSEPNMLYDRHPLISEPIFGGIIRGNLEGRFNDPAWLMAAYESMIYRQAMVIFCLPPISVVQANVERSEQMDMVSQLTGPIYQAYHTLQCQLAITMGIRSVRWDYTNRDTLDLTILCQTIYRRFDFE